LVQVPFEVKNDWHNFNFGTLKDVTRFVLLNPPAIVSNSGNDSGIAKKLLKEMLPEYFNFGALIELKLGAAASVAGLADRLSQVVSSGRLKPESAKAF
jgi:hypothetical protein